MEWNNNDDDADEDGDEKDIAFPLFQGKQS